MKSVAVTGYFATGSGAVYNLLQEYSTIDDGGLSEFEHIFLYDINGVFETVDRIMHGNSLYNSNAAINLFRKEMKRLNEIDYNWFGGYKYRCGNRFMEIIEEFIADITEYHIQRDWYGNFECRKISLERIIKDLGAVFLKHRRIDHNFGTKIIMDKENRWEFSFASEEKLKYAVRKLVNGYLDSMYSSSDKIIALNHMLSPQDAFRVPGYMPEDFKLIIVDRDIRDLYIYNKYTDVWGGNAFPTEIDEFIRFMKSYRGTEKTIECDQILRIQFEDLIYDYEATVRRVEEFVGLSPDNHIKRKKYFVPEKSIKNTQIFQMNSEWKKELERLEIEFPELVYSFPYYQGTSMEQLFDA